MAYDLLIKNGTVVDGTGATARRADVAGNAGRIIEIGKISDSAKQTIDAADCVVAPGFIDPQLTTTRRFVGTLPSRPRRGMTSPAW